MYDVVILTDYRYENPIKKNWYINQVLKEDQLLLEAIKKNGLTVCKKDWNCKKFDWQKTRSAIFRSTWDYFDKFDEFFEWKEKNKKKLFFINSSKIIDWNINKIYLKQLNKKGINIPDSIFIKKGDKTTLQKLFDQSQFTTAILKPNISGAARHTYKIENSELKNFEIIFRELISEKDMIFQKFINNIITEGEISLIMIGGKHTHSVKKKAKKGDFRVQDDHGGTVANYNPTKEEIIFAQNCIQKCPEKPLYARVDIIYDNNNKLALNELELIEPELWFREYPPAAEKLADLIKNYLFEIKNTSNSISS